MHNAQYDVYASAVWVEHLALSLSASLLGGFCHTSGSLSIVLMCTVACFSCDGFRALMDAFRIYMFTTSSKTVTISMCTCSHLDHAHSVRMRRAYAYTGHTYDIYIREILLFNSLVWGSLTLTPVMLGNTTVE